MKTAAILVVLAGSAQAACVAVPSDKILAQDLWEVVPLFKGLDPGAVIGLSPFPGTERVLSSRDLVLTARRYGLSFPPGQLAPSVCVERIVRSLSIEQVRAALLSALDSPAPRPEVTLEIIDFSNKPLPPGQLVFQLAALNRPPANDLRTPVIWPGKVVYDDQHTLSVWARVRISVNREIFLAKQSIAKGDVIQAGQIVAGVVSQFPWPEPPTASASQMFGKIARRAIPAGQRIATEALEDPQDVVRGETVQVKVVEGATTITLEAVAQSSGTKGESILVHNPSSGKNFRAVVENRDSVIVVPPPGLNVPSSPGSNL
jgi:flagellar basal body P-ring formation protein FlgA